jgi:glucose dehydrogenase
MYPAPGGTNMGTFIAWDASTGKIAQTKPEKFSVWSGVLVTAGGIACYGTLEGYLKCVDANDINKELFKFKTPSGIIGNVFTRHGQAVSRRFLGIGGWAGIGMAAGLERTGRLGRGRRLGTTDYTELGGT